MMNADERQRTDPNRLGRLGKVRQAYGLGERRKAAAPVNPDDRRAQVLYGRFGAAVDFATAQRLDIAW